MPGCIITLKRGFARPAAELASLWAAALDLFAETGLAATRLKDVATCAGVSKGTLYLYFDSKKKLFKAVVRSGIVRAIEEGEAMIEQFTGSASELLRHLEAYLDLALAGLRNTAPLESRHG